MKKGNIVFIVIIIILTSMIVYIQTKDGVYHRDLREYKPGVIQVTFQKNVSLDEAFKTVNSLNCTVNESTKLNDYIILIIDVPEGEEHKYRLLFEKEPTVKEAKRVPYK